MRVLVTESKPGTAAEVRADLVSRGHVVFVCHADGSDDFHCSGISGGGPCPLDLGMVDVVVDVRDDETKFTTREYGVVCAGRVNVPVVVAGPTLPVAEGQTYDSAAVQVAPHDAAAAVTAVVSLPETAPLHELRTTIRDFLATRTGDGRAVVSLVDHGYFADVVVRAAATPDRAMASELEHVVRSVLRRHRADWVHARLVLRQLSAPGEM